MTEDMAGDAEAGRGGEQRRIQLEVVPRDHVQTWVDDHEGHARARLYRPGVGAAMPAGIPRIGEVAKAR